MKTQKKRLQAAIALALTLTIAVASLIPIAPAAAAKIKCVAILYEAPNPVGVGQSLYIVGILTPPPAANKAIYYNYTFTITKPDGTTETIIHDSDDVAGHSISYVVDQIGTWSVKFSWNGDAE